jgi:hypothetical protein
MLITFTAYSAVIRRHVLDVAAAGHWFRVGGAKTGIRLNKGDEASVSRDSTSLSHFLFETVQPGNGFFVKGQLFECLRFHGILLLLYMVSMYKIRITQMLFLPHE